MQKKPFVESLRAQGGALLLSPTKQPNEAAISFGARRATLREKKMRGRARGGGGGGGRKYYYRGSTSTEQVCPCSDYTHSPRKSAFSNSRNPFPLNKPKQSKHKKKKKRERAFLGLLLCTPYRRGSRPPRNTPLSTMNATTATKDDNNNGRLTCHRHSSSESESSFIAAKSNPPKFGPSQSPSVCPATIK